MDLEKLLTSMAEEISPQDATEVLDSIGRFACQALGANDSGVLLLKAGGKIETPVSTSQGINRAHQLQGELDEGPCLDVIRDSTEVLYTGDAAHEPRWPSWGPKCDELGYRSAISVRLAVGERRYGSVNVYSTERHAFDSSDADALSVLGVHASVALAAAQERTGLVRSRDNRTIIGQAQGVLMTVFDIDADAAFAYLARQSQSRNVKLTQVAAEVVEQRGQVRTSIQP